MSFEKIEIKILKSMKYLAIILLFNFLGIFSCTNKETSLEQKPCTISELNRDLNYNDLVLGIPQNIIETLVKRPDTNGALGRNRDGYFHVRFQFEMTRLTDYAIRFQNEEAVFEYLKNLNYSFSHQNPEGDFQFIAPEEFLDDPDYQSPSEGDLASGTAFFAYSLGISLIALNQSQWYTDSNSLSGLRSEIEALNPNIQNMLDYLKSNSDLLNNADANAPNRLLFNAIAFYSLGTILNDEVARNLGIDFSKRALIKRNNIEGFFIEGGGWDSSYNGVAIKLGFELFTLIPNGAEQLTKNELEQAVTCATNWQKSRILPTGEISTDDNTRVFPGGEEFLGNEKTVDVIKTVKAFFYMATLSDKEEYELLAQRIIEYY